MLVIDPDDPDKIDSPNTNTEIYVKKMEIILTILFTTTVIIYTKPIIKTFFCFESKSAAQLWFEKFGLFTEEIENM